jgi:hypothetical protein
MHMMDSDQNRRNIMADQSTNPDELRELCDKVTQLTLTEAQRALLDAILKVAWTAVEQALDSEFDASFEPGQAQLTVAHHPGASTGSFSIGTSIRGSIKPTP